MAIREMTIAVNDGGGSRASQSTLDNLKNKYSSGSTTPKRTQTTAVSTPTVTQPTYTTNDYMSQLNALYNQQQSQAAAYQEQLRAAAQNAYNNNKAALDAAYNNKMGVLADNYNSTVGTLGRQYDASKGEVNDDSERALREAYVNKLLTGKNMQQQLSAQGISGGAAETTLASLHNNYGNARNNIETTRAKNLADLMNTYQDNLASALQQYNLQRANAEDQRVQLAMQIESDLANMLVNSYGSQFNSLGNIDNSYFNMLSDLVSKQAAYSYENAQANNPVQKVTSLAANDMGTYTDYAKWLNVADQLKGAGQNQDNVFAQLVNAGADDSTLQYIMNQLYG